jgi:hypothetical protein
VLDRAALDASSGPPFFPGIESNAVMQEATTFSGPFRISNLMSLGSLTKNNAIPWQADFNACSDGWWPSQRPNQVLQNGPVPDEWVPVTWGGEDMARQWWKLGYVVRAMAGGAEEYREIDRQV